ncbi:hypothetical protein ACHAWF_006055, partial [Thalassiosira exigua]
EFRLKPQSFSTTTNFPIGDGLKVRLGNGSVRITQIPVNSNIATTEHKLQGMSKDTLIVISWNYDSTNWGARIYVVLKRIRALSGLYLCEKLDIQHPFKVPKTLLKFERG